MSENTKPNSQNDEVDLGQVFKLIGNAINKILNFILFIFKAFFSVFINFFKIVINSWKIILAVVFIGFIGGYLLQKQKPQVYSSQMLVRPYFESKFQLISNVNYYNALLENKDYKQMSEIFNIEEDRVSQVVEFDIEVGPESQNDRLILFDEYKKKLDSLTASNVTYETFIENRSIYAGRLYEITVYSQDNEIFKSLEPGLNSSFKNNYSEKIKERRDSVLAIEKRNILKGLEEVKTLQTVYIEILEENAKNPKDKGVKLGDGLSISTNDDKTREFDLLEREIELRNKLQELDKSIALENDYFDVVSSFQEIGTPSSSWKENYILIFPIIGLLVLFFFYLLFTFVKYVKSYEE